MKFYLAHPLASKDKVRIWQLKCELQTGVLFTNPFFDLDSWEKKINKTKQKRYEADATPIIETDLQLMGKCDGVIAIIDGNFSYGTICEAIYAKVFKKPLFMVITNGNAKHPWFRYHADKIFTKFEDLEKYLKILIEKERAKNVCR
jgi:nucleoside 2-deoxyribosyltransferase